MKCYGGQAVSSESSYVESIEIRELFGHLDVKLEFGPGVNVLYGHNGSLKTTTLHIIANILSANFDRFAFLPFRSISLELSHGRTVRVNRYLDREDITGESDYLVKVDCDRFSQIISTNEVTRYEPTLPGPSGPRPPTLTEEAETGDTILPVVYLPAFRTTVEAFRAVERAITPAQTTHLVRSWLMPFVPRVFYPTLQDVQQALTGQQGSMSRNMIDGYLCAANSFLEGKRIAVDGELDDRGRSSLRILHDDGSKSRLGALSSGEREIVTLLFAAAVPDSHEVLLIDEPETSLHVTWQRKLLDTLAEAFHYQQIIGCTHSPVIAAKYDAKPIEIELSSTDPDSDTPCEF